MSIYYEIKYNVSPKSSKSDDPANNRSISRDISIRFDEDLPSNTDSYDLDTMGAVNEATNLFERYDELALERIEKGETNVKFTGQI